MKPWQYWSLGVLIVFSIIMAGALFGGTKEAAGGGDRIVESRSGWERVPQPNGGDGKVTRVVMRDGAICYIYEVSSSGGGGISCLAGGDWRKGK